MLKILLISALIYALIITPIGFHFLSTAVEDLGHASKVHTQLIKELQEKNRPTQIRPTIDGREAI